MACIDFLVASMEYESFMELCYDHLCSTSLGIARDEDLNDGGFGQDQDASGQDQDDSSKPNDSFKPAASGSSSAGVCGASASGSSVADAVHGPGIHCNSQFPSGDAQAQGTGGDDRFQHHQHDGAACSQQQHPLPQTSLQELNVAIATMGI